MNSEQNDLEKLCLDSPLVHEYLGRIARAAWVGYCNMIGEEKPSHTAPWKDVSKQDQQADMCIGTLVANATMMVLARLQDPNLQQAAAQLTDRELAQMVWMTLADLTEKCLYDRLGVAKALRDALQVNKSREH